MATDHLLAVVGCIAIVSASCFSAVSDDKGDASVLIAVQADVARCSGNCPYDGECRLACATLAADDSCFRPLDDGGVRQLAPCTSFLPNDFSTRASVPACPSNRGSYCAVLSDGGYVGVECTSGQSFFFTCHDPCLDAGTNADECLRFPCGVTRTCTR